MRRPLLARFHRLAAPLLAAFSAACSSSSASSGTTSPTLVTVSPASFAGDVTCADLPGAWRTYVATLFDVTDDPSDPFELPSSPPVPCAMPVSFAFVVPGHYYIARIQGFDRTDIEPYGGLSGGSPHMVDAATKADVPARWTTTCGHAPDLADAGLVDGDGDGGRDKLWAQSATVSWQSTNVLMQYCEPLHDDQPGGDTSVTLDLAAIRGQLACGSAPGQIARIRVVPEDPTVPEPKPDPLCDQPVTIAGLAPGVTYAFRVEAYEAGMSGASWGSTCRATTKPGITVPAACDLLSDKGAALVDIASLLDQAQHACAPGDITSYSAVLLGAGNQPGELACTANAAFTGLAPATWQIVVDAFDASRTVVFSAYCEAAVVPGLSKPAYCTVAPVR